MQSPVDGSGQGRDDPHRQSHYEPMHKSLLDKIQGISGQHFVKNEQQVHFIDGVGEDRIAVLFIQSVPDFVEAIVGVTGEPHTTHTYTCGWFTTGGGSKVHVDPF